VIRAIGTAIGNFVRRITSSLKFGAPIPAVDVAKELA